MSNIRERIDPTGTLPMVSFDPLEVMAWGEVEKRETMEVIVEVAAIDETMDSPAKTVSGSVGECILYTEEFPEPYMNFANIEIDEDLRGNEIGLATYIAALVVAEERGLPFETHAYNQTAPAKRIWEQLAALGVAEVIEPFHSLTDPDFTDRFNGRYRVPAPYPAE